MSQCAGRVDERCRTIAFAGLDRVPCRAADAPRARLNYTPASVLPHSPEARMTLAPPPDDDDDSPDQGELEFITELCAVVAEQAELQPILDWLVHKTTRLLGTEECSIKLITAGGDVAKTIMFDNRRAGIEAGSSTWSPMVKTLVMGFLMSQPGELA